MDAPDARTEAVMLDGLTKRFNGQLAVNAVSLSVARGTIVGVIGPSGAGKTTAIRMMTGAIAPTSGRVRVLGEDPRRFSRRTRERIGYMPQLFALYPDLTAGENVDFVASLFGLLWLRRRRRVREILQLVDLWDVRARRAGALSGGMQRRLELACALVHEPDLMFLDEPSAGIDPLLRGRIWDALQDLRDAGRTLLVTTQYVTEAEQCDRVALISNGRLIAFAAPDELRRDAMGGDLIEVETDAPFDATTLRRLDEVRSVQQRTPHSFRVTVEHAGTGTPLVVDTIGAEGVDVESAREHRPSFDEVFAALVERDEDGGMAEAVAGSDGSAQPSDGRSSRAA
jgi:ABC-2 type transport system ATP-binding protein